jgi:hypothetical protein
LAKSALFQSLVEEHKTALRPVITLSVDELFKLGYLNAMLKAKFRNSKAAAIELHGQSCHRIDYFFNAAKLR